MLNPFFWIFGGTYGTTETVSVSVFGRKYRFRPNFGLAEMKKALSVSVSVSAETKKLFWFRLFTQFCPKLGKSEVNFLFLNFICLLIFHKHFSKYTCSNLSYFLEIY